jgi:hypothetical protein
MFHALPRAGVRRQRKADPAAAANRALGPDATAEAKAGTSARSKAAGYAGVLDKPFLVLEFLATLKHAVDKP